MSTKQNYVGTYLRAVGLGFRKDNTQRPSTALRHPRNNQKDRPGWDAESLRELQLQF